MSSKDDSKHELVDSKMTIGDGIRTNEMRKTSLQRFSYLLNSFTTITTPTIMRNNTLIHIPNSLIVIAFIIGIYREFLKLYRKRKKRKQQQKNSTKYNISSDNATISNNQSTAMQLKRQFLKSYNSKYEYLRKEVSLTRGDSMNFPRLFRLWSTMNLTSIIIIMFIFIIATTKTVANNLPVRVIILTSMMQVIREGVLKSTSIMQMLPYQVNPYFRTYI